MALTGGSTTPPVMAKGGKLASGHGRGTQSQGKGCEQGGRGGWAMTARMSPAFKGYTMELGGHVFQVFHKSNNQNQLQRQ